MASPQTPAPSTTTNPPSTDAARGTDALSLDRLRVAVPIVDHAAQLAAQAHAEETQRKVATLTAQVAELEAVASKAAITGQAQQHELTLIDRRHNLEMARIQHQWALDDARKARDRQLVEIDRERDAAVEAQRVAEVRRQCDAISHQNVELHAAIASEESRISRTSAAIGGFVGLIGGGFAGAQSRQNRKGRARGAGAGIAGVGGALTAVATIAAPYFKPTAPQLPTPVNAPGWDAYLRALTIDNVGLRGQLAALQVTTVSLPTMAASAAGIGALTYAVAG
jgi:hypothetical protein